MPSGKQISGQGHDPRIIESSSPDRLENFHVISDTTHAACPPGLKCITLSITLSECINLGLKLWPLEFPISKMCMRACMHAASAAKFLTRQAILRDDTEQEAQELASKGTHVTACETKCQCKSRNKPAGNAQQAVLMGNGLGVVQEK